VGYFESLLVGQDGVEQSFEEVRAAAWRARRAEQQQQEQQQEQLEQQRQLQEQQQRESQQRQQVARQQQQQQQRAAAVPRQALKPPSKAVLAVCADDSGDENSVAAAQKAEQRAQLAQQHAQQRQQQLRQQQLQQQAQSAAAVFGSEPTITVNMRAGSAAAAAAACGSEPTVTVNTRAALESMNQMFSSDMATMTLPRDAISNAAGARSAAAYGAAAGGRAAGRRQGGFGGSSGGSFGSAEPTVTINTRAALDAMNGMFGCGDDTTTMHGFSQQGNRAHAAAAAGGGARYGSSFGGMPGSGGSSSSGAEPTVTINTRAAFDAMNDMFGDMTGQQTLTGRQMGMAHGRVSAVLMYHHHHHHVAWSNSINIIGPLAVLMCSVQRGIVAGNASSGWDSANRCHTNVRSNCLLLFLLPALLVLPAGFPVLLICPCADALLCMRAAATGRSQGRQQPSVHGSRWQHGRHGAV
jgi:hypothetical protein